MFGNTFVLPQAGGDIILNKINQDKYSSEYLFRNTTEEYRIKIRHSKVEATAKRAAADRHNIEVVKTIFAAGDVAEYSQMVYFVIEHKPGNVPTPLVDALFDWGISSANANITSLLGWES